VSAATFPSYFLKDSACAEDVHCEADIRLFGERIAPALGITRRYVGTEPDCAVTARYNAQMKEHLPAYGVEVVEVPRKEVQGQPVSASRVRALVGAGCREALSALLPQQVTDLILHE